MAVVPGVHLAVSPRICPAPGGHRQARAAAVSDPPSSARLEPQRPQTGSRDSRKWSTCAQQCQPCEPEHSGTQRHAHGAALGKSGASATACLQQPRRDRFPLSCESAQQRGRRYQVCPVEADVPSRVRGYPAVEEVLGQTLLARRPTLLHAILSSSRRSVVTARCGHQLSRAIQRLLLVVHVNKPPCGGTGPGHLEKGG